MITRWATSSVNKTKTSENSVKGNPIAGFIIVSKKQGLPTNIIIEKLIRKGYTPIQIKKAILHVKKFYKKSCDWRSPTSINETARFIRNDIRKGKITYAQGMTILLKARDNLRVMILNPRTDLRLKQILYEIKITKKLLMKKFADPIQVKHFKVVY